MNTLKILIALCCLSICLSCSNTLSESRKEVDVFASTLQQNAANTRKSGFDLIFVKGGEFMMGGVDEADDGGLPGARLADECPHPVSLEDFYIGKHEVTQADWIEIMGNNPNKLSECLDCPVSQVSWEDVQEFIDRLNLKTLINFRLPTESEWEFAAKGGIKSQHYMYAGANHPDEIAWFANNSGGNPHPVGQLQPNELGAYDMSGNIWEWCSDIKKRYPCDDINNELAFDSRVLRGGTFGNRAQSIRVIDRNARDPSTHLRTLGFRLAK